MGWMSLLASACSTPQAAFIKSTRNSSPTLTTIYLSKSPGSISRMAPAARPSMSVGILSSVGMQANKPSKLPGFEFYSQNLAVGAGHGEQVHLVQRQPMAVPTRLHRLALHPHLMSLDGDTVASDSVLDDAQG